MTQDEVIALAREAGLEMDEDRALEPETIWYVTTNEMNRLAALIEAKLKADLLAGAGEPVAEVYRFGKSLAGREWHGVHWYDSNVDTPSGTKIYTADQVAAAVLRERLACSKTKAASPRKLQPVGRGTLLDEQQYCFDKGWKEGAASVRSAIRARGNT